MAALVAAGCRSPTPSAPTPSRIATVRLTGVRAFDGSTLLQQLGSQARAELGQVADSRLVSADARRLRGHYLRNGYFSVGVDAEVERRAGGMVISFAVNEGTRATVGSIELPGLPPEVAATMADRGLGVAVGEPFVYETYLAARDRLASWLLEAGYSRSKVKGNVVADPATRRAALRYAVEAGPRLRFGAVTMVGVSPVLADAVRARVTIEPGAWFDPRALASTRVALHGLGRFSSVAVDVVPGAEPDVAAVRVAVVEAGRHEWRLGVGAGADPTRFEVRGRASYARLGFPTTLTNSRLELRPSFGLMREATLLFTPGLDVTAAVDRTDLLRPRLHGEALAGYTIAAFEAYRLRGPRLRLGLDTPLGRVVRIGAGWLLRDLEFSSIDLAIDDASREELGLAGGYRLGSYEQVVEVDLRDDAIDPTTGVFAEVRSEVGGAAAGGEFDYVKLTPEARGYVSLGPAVLAGRLRVGRLIGDRPITERYLAGGASSQRGFPERRLGPEVSNGEATVVIGGAASIETGVELRAPAFALAGRDLDLALFLDGAEVANSMGTIRARGLHWAAGGGLRMGTPIGPIRFDLGYRLNRFGLGEPRSGQRLAYHVGVGHAF